LDTFYNALNPVDQDSLNSAADGNLLERHSQAHSCSQSANKCCDYRHDRYSQTISSNPTSGIRKSHDEIRITCGGAHPYYQCLAADGNTFPELRDNIQGYVSAAAVNYNQGNSGYRPPGVANQIRPPSFAQPNVQNNQNRFGQPQGYNRGNNFNQNSSYQAPMQQNQVVPLSELEKIKKMNEINMKAMQIQINNVKNDSTSGSGPLSSNTIANPKGELKAITTRSDIVLDGPSVPMSPPFINPDEDEREEETLTDPELGEFTIKVPPPLFQKTKPPSQRNFILHQRDPLHPNIPYPLRMHKQKQQEKDKVQIHKFWQMFKQLHINITLADALILIPKDVFIPVGKFTFLADFVIVDYESEPRVPLILERPFLRTACALIDVHGEEMILRDGDERLTLNMIHDTSSYSNQPQKESINMINIYDDSCEDFLEDLFATNHLSGNPTFSSHTDLTSSEVKDDIFDPEGGNVLIEKLLVLDPTKNLPPPYNINPLSGSTTSS
nr:reverse transcriptase domain-containing protein [Tanacetum cinerariifolium]